MDIQSRLKKFFNRDTKEDVRRMRFIASYLNDHNTEHGKFIQNALIAKRYYVNDTDILSFDRFKDVNKDRAGVSKNPLRNADNRIPFNWHGLLLNQKASYLGTIPPKFDIKDDEKNKKIAQTLGNKYKKVFFDLIINAGNCGIAWVHYWVDEPTGKLRFMSIDPLECFPIWSNRGDNELDGMIRRYPVTNPETGKTDTCYEYWDKNGVTTYVQVERDLRPLNQFVIVDPHSREEQRVNWFNQDTRLKGKVPFIAFANNKEHIGDLKNIKGLIDTYSKVYSGFANDLDDIQQMIFILTNYGGQDKEEFLKDLMQSKVVKFEQDKEDDPSGLEQMTIEIPTEARTELLKITQEQIFIQGQGVNPNKDNLNNNSGIALKFLYSLLDMKCGVLQAEFTPALEEFVYVIYHYLYPSESVEDVHVSQEWERSAISDALEQAEVISRVAVVTSDVAIAKGNPLVGENWQEEVELRKQQKIDELMMADMYKVTPSTENGSYKDIFRQQQGTNNQLIGRDKQLVNQKAGVDPEGDDTHGQGKAK